MNVICLHIETTGLNKLSDEVLRLSVLDSIGSVIFDQHFKPLRHDSWANAELYNKISPESVADCFPLLHYKDEIQRILAAADIIVGYNIAAFDLPILFHNGIDNYVKDHSFVVDVMDAFRVIGDGYCLKPLTECAEYYDYPGDASGDCVSKVNATLYCFYKIFGMPPVLPEGGAGVYPSKNNTDELPSSNNDIPVATKKEKKKSGRVMIGFGVFFILSAIGGANPILFIIGAVLLYFGYKRYKEFKNRKKESGI